MIVAIEGIDGSGKSTQMGLVSDRLLRDGFQVCQTKMTLFANPAYKHLESTLAVLEGESQQIHASAMESLVVLQTFKTVREVIIPQHQRGAVVLCDRYLLGGLAYLRSQSSACYGYDALIGLMPTPDVSVYLKIRFSTAMRRCMARSGYISDARVEHLRRIYEQLEALSPSICGVHINGSLSSTRICDEIVSSILSRMESPMTK